MLNYHENAASLVREEELKWKSNVLKPINQSNIGKWKSQMSPNQVRFIESILNKPMSDLNYKAVEKATLIQRFLDKMIELPLSLLFKIRFGK
jgi:hypothetical protein